MVEGDDDSRFWKTRIDGNNCQLVITTGKEKLLEASHLLDNQNFEKALGVVDLDYDWADSVRYSPRVTPTDFHDLEMMMIDSDAFQKVLVEYGDAEKINAFEFKARTPVFNALIERALPFGLLRWYNYSHLNNTRVCFDDLSPYRFVDRDTWALDVQGLQDEFVKKAKAKNSFFDINHLANWQSTAVGDPMFIIQGHDALRILAQGLKTVLGNSQSDDSDLARKFRLAYEQSRFEKTQLCTFVRNWERTHGTTVFSTAI